MSAYIEEHRERFGVEPICRTLEVSASAYYQRRTGQRSPRAIEDEWPLARIREVHERNYCAYGYRRMAIALKREGEDVGRGRVQRLMREAGIQGAKRRGKPWGTTKADLTAQRRPDLVERDFSAKGPNRLWVGDLTYLRSWDGALFVSFVIDAFSRRSSAGSWPPTCAPTSCSTRCGWPWANASMAPTSGSWPTPTAARNTPPPTTPRNWTTTASWLQSEASATPTTTRWQSPSSTPFKTELIADRSWRSKTQLELAIVEYIAWFNNDRLHESLGDISPVEFESLQPPPGRF